jgi:hypothetical protein
MFKIFDEVFVKKMNKAMLEMYLDNKGKSKDLDQRLEDIKVNFNVINNGNGTTMNKFELEKCLLNLCSDGYISGEEYYNFYGNLKRFCRIKGLRK